MTPVDDSRGMSRTASAELVVERGVSPDRMNVLAVILSAMLGVGVSVGLSDGLLLGVGSFIATGLAVFALLALIYKVRLVRHATMSAMHWLTQA